jgi:alpha-tubulin suppressor-like RCC1 family protein
VTAIAAGGSHSVALKSDGSLWSWGNNDSGQLVRRSLPTQVPGLTGVVAITAGENFTLVRKSDGSVWSCHRTSRR